MRVTTKGQVTIPRNIREKLGIVPQANIDFLEDDGKFYIVKTTKTKRTKNLPLPDFFIGAHASVSRLSLVTRDIAKYNTYFPQINLVCPT